MPLVVKTCTRIRTFVFGVCVVGVTQLKLEVLKRPHIPQQALHHMMASQHANGHPRLCHRAIGAAVFAGRQTQVAAVKQQCAAHCATFAVAG